MNVMDHLVELVDMNVFQNLNDPDSHSCKFDESFFDTPNSLVQFWNRVGDSLS